MPGSSLPFLLGFFLDLLLADPPRWPHPVNYFGWLAQAWERRLYGDSIARGAFFWMCVMGCVVLTLLLVVAVLSFLPIWLQSFFWAYVCYACLALRGLHQAAASVESALQANDLQDARRALSRIVGRETDQLSVDAVRRAAVETVAENCSDGVVAPMFFCLLLGPVGMLLYKTVNTLDSMVGYKNERYARFGTVSARMDDGWNALPARLTALLLLLAAFVLGYGWKQGLRTVRRDARKHASPNAGFPEAAVAGTLGVRLGGPSRYHGRLVEKAWLGDDNTPVTAETFDRTIKLLYLSSFMMALLVCGILYVFHCGPLGLFGLFL